MNGSIDWSQTEDIIHKFASELEAAYSDFLGVHEDYEDLVNFDEKLAEHGTVNGLTCQQYFDTVTGVYEAAIKNFKLLKGTESEKNARPIVNDIEYLTNMMRDTLGEVNTCTATGNVCSTHDISKLNLLKEQLDSLSSKLKAQKKELYVVIDQDIVKATVDDVDSLVRNADRSKSRIDDLVLQSEKADKSNTKPELYGTAPYLEPHTSYSLTLPSSLAPSTNIAGIPSSYQPVSTGAGLLRQLSLSDGVTSTLSVPSINIHTSAPSSFSYSYASPPASHSFSSAPGTCSSGFTTSFSSTRPTMTTMHDDNAHSPGTPISSTGYSPRLTPADELFGRIDTSYPAQDIKVKRIELPTFNGDRKFWPEFKIIWPRMAIPSIKSKEALVRELRNCLKGGHDVFKEIRNTPIIGPSVFDIMWNRLCEEFDNQAASVDAALKNLYKLKQVAVGDYKGLIKLVNEVKSSYLQLHILGQLSYLTI